MTAPSLRPFPLGAVRIDDASVFARARDEMLHLARAYPVDRLLAVFRRNAGLDTRGALPPGNWEDFGHPDERPWNEADYPGREHAPTANLLRGHYAGHFLSMLALAAAGERDPALQAKVDEFVAGLGEVQAALAATGRYSHPGFLAAYGEWQFSRLEDHAPYGEIWAPYYTCHKLMAGLLDAHELTGSAEASAIATAMGHWVHHRLARLDAARRQRMWSLYIAGEFGGMNETLARLSAAANEPLFLETAAYFDQENVLEAGASGIDILTDMHANQHLPQLIGYVETYEQTDEARYLEAAQGIWRQIVPGRMYAHGGTGESELWGPPGTVAGDVGHRNAETCAAYNLLKLARKLFAHTLDPAYMDYYERTLLNHILGSRRAVSSATSPEVTYMFPVHPGAFREYGNTGTCCGGTGLENHVKYQDTVYFQGPDGLYVNLPIDSALDWEEAGLRIRLRSGYPLGEGVTLAFDGDAAAERSVHLRVPAWAAGDLELRLNGEPTGVDPVPGRYVAVTRAWKSGDELHLATPARLRAEPASDDERQCALFLGPTLLLARSELTTPLPFPLAARRDEHGLPSGPEPLAELASAGVVTLDGVEFEPCWSGLDTKYHMYVRSHEAEIAFDGVGSGMPGVAIEILTEPAPSGWYTTAPAVRLHILEAETAAAESVEWRLGDADWRPYTAPFTVEVEGVQRIEARVRDSEGRTAATAREISVDTAPPVSRATVKELGSSWEITLHADDGVSGVERIQWEGPGTFWGTFQEAFVRALGPEPQVIEYAATDRAGNEEPRRRLVIPGTGSPR
ncbi:beta-L-arabinofuranosidase domain-containing protein [Glycomyces niveus]|uniref:Glycoside hydrolase family 127 protein n=1 Tax=Glycomyces niveus TaxID=2820287 RepID=A0ABS3U2E1_9ACTN|nr:beta-L-arabinofuranosidase domain-containing protein [Glycomyces sp. NEAU-S30]MBO3732938.1 glycoside hydrolase family 127 protein [Glycomyces sp. NEAU-S30]